MASTLFNLRHMPKISIWYIFLMTCLVTGDLRSLDSSPLSGNIPEKLGPKNIQRNLDLAFQSVHMKRVIAWYGFGSPFEDNDSDDLYLPDYWAIFISSNETILNSKYATCYYFKDFICKQPSCSEDSSSLYSLNYSKFSIIEATRLSTQGISIAEGAWKLNSSVLYIQSCESIDSASTEMSAIGQIGLGLSGKAYQNFQTLSLPLFSIIFHSMTSAELIFGFNSSYVNDTPSGTTLPCDLDWKMRVDSMTIGDTIISSDPVSMIFDIQTSSLTLPASYYYNLTAYFWGLSSSIECWNRTKNLVCFYCGESTISPSLVFLLEDGTRFSLSRESYLLKAGYGCYSAQFFFHNSILSKVGSIVLGHEAMSQYYIVFQQFNKETTGITLYPHLIDNTPTNYGDLVLESYHFSSTESTDSNESVTNTTTEHNPHPDSPKTETNAYQETSSPEPSKSSPEDRVSIPNDGNNGSDNTILYVVIGTVLLVMTCIFIILTSMTKREKLQGDQKAGKQRSTVEMNESSYFVTAHQYVQSDDHDNENGCSE